MKLAIPKARRETILKQMHDDATAGHMGIAARIEKIFGEPNYIMTSKGTSSHANDAQK